MTLEEYEAVGRVHHTPRDTASIDRLVVLLSHSAWVLALADVRNPLFYLASWLPFRHKGVH